MKNYIAVGIVMLCTLSTSAQTVGIFAAKNINTGNSVSLSDFKSSPGAVIIFTSNATVCAYDEYYTDRLAAISKKYDSKIPVIFINAHANEFESEATKTMGKLLGKYYLIDADQQAMQSLKATKSPEAFVLKNTGGNFSVLYHGAIDDNAQVATDVNEHYLSDAIDALLAGEKPMSAMVRPVGCIIRKKL
jgi:thiol-disulfide isomerase/thioredoxin